MPVHYVYDSPDSSVLCQGDVLRRSGRLVDLLEPHFPNHPDHERCNYFMVVTQSCDLVRRKGKPPTSPYITLAAVCPVEDVLYLEARGYQQAWQRANKVIGAKATNKLRMFLDRLIENNEPGYFFVLREEPVISQNCCAILRLVFTVRSEHYDLCLDAKIAQLREPFQAKLGWLLGHLYSRVATQEWDSHYHGNPRAADVVNELIDRTLISLPDERIDEGVADLQHEGQYDSLTHEQVYEYIKKKKLISRKDRFREAALQIINDNLKPLDQIRTVLVTALRSDNSITDQIKALLKERDEAGENQDETLLKIMQVFLAGLRTHLSDASTPQKADIFEKLLKGILQDDKVTRILK